MRYCPRAVPGGLLVPLFAVQDNCLRSRRSEVRILSGVPKQSHLAFPLPSKNTPERLLCDFSVPLTSPDEDAGPHGTLDAAVIAVKRAEICQFRSEVPELVIQERKQTGCLGRFAA